MTDAPPRPPWGPAEIDAYAARLEEEYARLRPQLPELPPGELLSILACRLRPFGTGKVFFLLRREDGSYVF